MDANASMYVYCFLMMISFHSVNGSNNRDLSAIMHATNNWKLLNWKRNNMHLRLIAAERYLTWFKRLQYVINIIQHYIQWSSSDSDICVKSSNDQNTHENNFSNNNKFISRPWFQTRMSRLSRKIKLVSLLKYQSTYLYTKISLKLIEAVTGR